MKARRVFSGKGIRIVVSVVLLMFFSLQLAKAQDWYNPAWPYRAPITIGNSLGSVLTEYQVLLNLGAAGPWSASATDGSDLRFTTDDGITEIPYWIEEWNYGTSAEIWIKVPEIEASPASTTIYMYYGSSTVSTSNPVETPPAGPFTKSSNNPGVINGVGAPAADADILPENIVYDPVTQHYWMVLSDQTSGSRVGLVYSDNPTNPDAWYWSGYVVNSAIAPHLIEYNGTWYIFYGDRSVASPNPISVASSSSVSGPYTKVGEVLPAGATGTWEDARVDEPYVFQRSDGTWILIYMGDAGSNVEQVGYATASSITGPYTKYTGNPCIPFGAAGSFDAGTVADPWVYEYDGVYYIGYTVSPTTSSPWQTALATTTDWVTFTKHGIILPTGTEFNSFRGAVTRIGNQYVFSYTGGPASGDYRLCIATQPVFQVPEAEISAGGSNGDETFDFFDGFDGSSVDLTKWVRGFGTISSQTSISDGVITLTATSTYIRLNATSSFGLGFIGETYGRHRNYAASASRIVEYGFGSSGTPGGWEIRITDNHPNAANIGYWQWRFGDNFNNFSTIPNTNWHLFTIYRNSPDSAVFKIDNEIYRTSAAAVPTGSLYPFIMSYGDGNIFDVDWTRVRKWAGAEMSTTIGTTEFSGSQWTGAIDFDWHTEGNWIGGIPDVSSDVLIPDVTNQPIISADAFCNSIIVETGASLGLSGTITLEIKGNLTNSGSFAAGSGTVLLSGSSQEIGGSSQTAFTNLTINSNDTVTFGSNASITGDLNIYSGVVNPGSYALDHTTPVSGTLTLADGASVLIGGTGTLPQNFSTYSLASTSKVEYYGTDQEVGAAIYGNLVLSGSGIKTISASITVSGNTTIKGAAVALLSNGSTSTTASLILGNLTASAGTWGSTSSAAGYRNDTYFSPAGTGILSVANSIPAGTWLGINSSSWSSTTNWAGGAVPGPATDVVITDYAFHKPIIRSLSAPAECNNLTVNQGAMLTIEPGQALTVNGNLINDGSIYIESSWVNSNGSLIVEGSPSGIGTVSYKRFLREGDDTGDKHLLASPVDGQDVTDFISAFDSKIDSVRIWNEFEGVWERIESGQFVSGQGYNIYQADNSDGEFTFSGSLVNSATFTATSPYADPYLSRPATDRYGNTDPTQITWTTDRGYISEAWANWGGGGWNLLGNPFTSAMNVDQFITVNASDFDPYYQALYVYDGKNGYYRYVATVVPGYDQQGDPEFIQGGTFGNRIQAGQGFLVMANNNEVEFDFSPAMQAHQTALPLLKSASVEEPWPGLKLKVKWGEKENLTTIVFNDVMKNSLDPGYDVGLLSTGPEVEIYTTLVEKDEAINLTRQALPVAGADTLKIPVGIDCYAGAEVTFSAYTIPMGNRRFWLEDRTAGTFTDLSLKGYTVTLPENTFGTGRFYIIASTNTPTAIKPTIRDNGDLRIWVARNMIVLKGNASQDARCELFDVNGKRILERQLTDGELNTIDIPAGLHGIYLVRVIDRQVITTRKIVIL